MTWNGGFVMHDPDTVVHLTDAPPNPPSTAGRSVVRLNEGDRVLVVCDRDVTPEQMHQVTEWLRGRFPGVEFTALGGDGIQSVIVQGADHEEDR